MNGDFENRIEGIEGGLPLYLINPTPGKGTPDYYNAEFRNLDVPVNWIGFQPPYSGTSYVGIFLYQELNLDPKKYKDLALTYKNIREYIEIPLSAPLKKDSCYHLTMYLNLGNNCRFTTKDLGVYFSNIESVTTGSAFLLQLKPQIEVSTFSFLDTLNWSIVELDYIAKGEESFITIGNFHNDKETEKAEINSQATLSAIYVLIDNISLVPCGKMKIQNAFDLQYLADVTREDSVLSIDSSLVFDIIIYDLAFKKIAERKATNVSTLDLTFLDKGVYYYQILCSLGTIKSGKCKRQ